MTRRSMAVVTGPMFTATLGPHLAQLMRAAEEQRKTHDQLIAAGYTWDGADGYTAPDVPSGPLTGDELRSILEGKQ